MTVRQEEHPSGLDRMTLPARPHRGPVDYRTLRQNVTIKEVLDLIGWQPVRQHGPQLRGPCPVHKSMQPKSRIFSVNTERNIFQCFKCGAKGNQLDLWALVTEKTLYEAAWDLCEKMAIKPPMAR